MSEQHFYFPRCKLRPNDQPMRRVPIPPCPPPGCQPQPTSRGPRPNRAAVMTLTGTARAQRGRTEEQEDIVRVHSAAATAAAALQCQNPFGGSDDVTWFSSPWKTVAQSHACFLITEAQTTDETVCAHRASPTCPSSHKQFNFCNVTFFE